MTSNTYHSGTLNKLQFTLVLSPQKLCRALISLSYLPFPYALLKYPQAHSISLDLLSINKSAPFNLFFYVKKGPYLK